MNKSPDVESSRQQILSLAALVLGVVLIGLSLLWPAVSSGRSQWSDEQARQYQSVSAELHALSHQFGDAQEQGRDVAAVNQKLETTKAEFDRLHEQLEAARQSPLRIASLLRLLGFASIVVGVIAHYWDRLRPPV